MIRRVGRGAGVVGLAVAGAAAGLVRRAVPRRVDETPQEVLLPFGRTWRVETDDGAHLAVTDAGPAPGPPVVLVHCWMGGREVWAPVAHRLIAAGHRVILYDQRGHGSSTCGADGYGMSRLGADLATILEALSVDGAVIAGHSMGGMSIMALAAHQPAVLAERASAVVLVSTAASGLGAVAGRPLGDRRKRRAAWVVGHPLLARLWAGPLGPYLLRGIVGAHARRHHLTLSARMFSSCPSPARASCLAAMLDMDLREGIAGVTVPATVVVGTNDRLTPEVLAQQLAGALPRARLVTLDGHGHMLPLEAPREITAVISTAGAGAGQEEVASGTGA